MHVALTKKEMAVLLVLMDGANSKSGYWWGFEKVIPIVMEEQGIKDPIEGESICDGLQQKLKIWIEQ